MHIWRDPQKWDRVACLPRYTRREPCTANWKGESIIVCSQPELLSDSILNLQDRHDEERSGSSLEVTTNGSCIFAVPSQWILARLDHHQPGRNDYNSYYHKAPPQKQP